MALYKPSNISSPDLSNHKDNQTFWQQLAQEFAFEGIDEEQLRRQTEQWITCANELLGPLPSRSRQKTKR